MQLYYIFRESADGVNQTKALKGKRYYVYKVIIIIHLDLWYFECKCVET